MILAPQVPSSNSPLPATSETDFAHWQSLVEKCIGYLAWREDRRDDDEAMDNALCFAFERFGKIDPPIGRDGKPSQKLRAYRAASYGWQRGKRGQQFVATKPGGYVDALDRIRPASVIASPIVDVSTAWIDDTEESLAIVASIDDAELQAIALLLVAGKTVATIAVIVRLAESTIYKRLEVIRRYVLRYLSQRK